MQSFLEALPRQAAQPRTVLAFELKLLHELGLGPDLDESRLSPGARDIVRALVEQDWPEIAQLKATSGQAAEVRHFLQGFLLYHLGKLPASRAAAVRD